MSLDPLKQIFNLHARVAFRRPLVSAKDEWNKVVKSTNCYSYALNIPDHGWGRPGELNKPVDERDCFARSEITPARITERLIQDGLVQVNIEDVDPKKHHVIALAINEGWDYHFYRWLEDGSWAHKDGEKSVSTKDHKGKPISSPEKAARGPYKKFIGYFKVPDTGVPYTRNPKILEKNWRDITSGITEPPSWARDDRDRHFRP